MYRETINELVKWKESENRKPLLLEGARQVGKTWLLKEFGSKHFPDYVYINCDNNPLLENLFIDYNIERIIRLIGAAYEKNITKQTLIIFDEIQESPKALTAFKYFNESSDYYIAGAGSLLGLINHSGTGFPVGNVHIINLYPLSFNEFLCAIDKEKLNEEIRRHDWEHINIFKETLIDCLRQYYYVGGMPEVINEYVRSKNFVSVRNIQNSILKSYEFDISKHAPKSIMPKINLIWNSIYSQLSKENKKFIYGALKSGARSKDYENALLWLKEAGLIYKVHRVNKLEKPIKFYEDLSAFKLFCLDLGLLGAMNNTSPSDVMIDNKIFSEYKGAFAEQYVCQEFVANKNTLPNYYTNKNSTLEIDFITENNMVELIEVKAEINLKAKSMTATLKSNSNTTGIRFSMADYKEQERLVNVPLYVCGEWLKSNL